jgi:hypothetical protein
VARDNVRDNAIGNISAHSRALEVFEGQERGGGTFPRMVSAHNALT